MLNRLGRAWRGARPEHKAALLGGLLAGSLCLGAAAATLAGAPTGHFAYVSRLLPRAMAYRTLAGSQAGLVDNLVRLGIVRSPEVEQVLRTVDRGHFTESKQVGGWWWVCASQTEHHQVCCRLRSWQEHACALLHSARQCYAPFHPPSFSNCLPTHPPALPLPALFLLQFAYLDAPQGIGCGATISAPHMHAYALELLAEQLRPGAKVLDVGSGTGWVGGALGGRWLCRWFDGVGGSGWGRHWPAQPAGLSAAKLRGRPL